MQKELVCFLVVGRMGKSLTRSKAGPFLIHPLVSRLYIFREEAGFPIPGAVYITLPLWMRSLRPRFIARLVRMIAEPVQLVYHSLKLRPDIINGYHLIPKGINSFIAARLSRSKCIISIIGGIVEIETYSTFRWFLKRLNILVLRNADLVTTKGSVVNAYLAGFKIPSSKVMVYNGAINLEKFRYVPETEKNIDILFIGTFRELKGPDRVLKMIAMLKKEFPSIRACFIGNGHLFQSCLELADKLGISGNVSFEGYLDEVSVFYQRSKIFVLPSQSEGLPTSMLEAMACGCVPVVSDVGNIRDTALNAVNAFLIGDYKNISAFVHHIRILLTDENLRTEMAEKGIRLVSENYSVRHQGEIVDRMIHKLFGGHDIP